jgi:CsbD-like.
MTEVRNNGWRTSKMTDEHTKGAISKAKGKVEEAAGKLTGNRRQEARGKAKQIQGSAQQGLGDVQDAVRRSEKNQIGRASCRERV